MSERASTAFCSYLSGTMAAMILPKRCLSFMKKKLMKQIEKRPMPMLETTEAADPSTEENTETSRNFLISSKITISILKLSPSFGNVAFMNSLKFDKGTEIFLAAFSMPESDTPLTMPLTTGTMRVAKARTASRVMHRVSEARSQSGAFFPLMLILCSRVITG